MFLDLLSQKKKGTALQREKGKSNHVCFVEKEKERFERRRVGFPQTEGEKTLFSGEVSSAREIKKGGSCPQEDKGRQA